MASAARGDLKEAESRPPPQNSFDCRRAQGSRKKNVQVNQGMRGLTESLSKSSGVLTSSSILLLAAFRRRAHNSSLRTFNDDCRAFRPTLVVSDA
jgi:hypothetical protein